MLYNFIRYRRKYSMPTTGSYLPVTSDAYAVLLQVTEGPLDEINVSTTSHVAIFRLIDHIKRACERLEQSLWPLLKPLIRELIDAS